MAYGLRNPFRFAMRPGTNEVWLTEVGWNGWEEVNRVPTDTMGNYGWPCYEGNGRQDGYDAANLPVCEELYNAGAVRSPFHTYSHDEKVVPGEKCVPDIGIVVVRGGLLPVGGRLHVPGRVPRRDVLLRLHAAAASGR